MWEALRKHKDFWINLLVLGVLGAVLVGALSPPIIQGQVLTVSSHGRGSYHVYRLHAYTEDFFVYVWTNEGELRKVQVPEEVYLEASKRYRKEHFRFEGRSFPFRKVYVWWQ